MKILTQLFLAVSTFIVQILVPDNIENPSPNQNSTEISIANLDSKNQSQLEYNKVKYQIRYALIKNPSKLQLYNNLETDFTAEEVFQNLSCSHLINGNFYTPDDKPIGWQLTDNKLESNYQQNQLFNGFLLINQDGSATINSDPNNLDQARIGVQTGPLLISNYQTIQLNLKQDKPARRSLALITNENKLIFATVTTTDNQFIGPYLADLAEIISQFGLKNSISIKSAINLDGGRASAFITPEHKQLEISKVGSFFCLQAD